MKKVLVLLVSVAAFSLGCGIAGPEDGSPMTYGGPCSVDGKCNEGLICVNHVCKDAPS